MRPEAASEGGCSGCGNEESVEKLPDGTTADGIVEGVEGVADIIEALGTRTMPPFVPCLPVWSKAASFVPIEGHSGRRLPYLYPRSFVVFAHAYSLEPRRECASSVVKSFAIFEDGALLPFGSEMLGHHDAALPKILRRRRGVCAPIM